jgi:hypothetical protein
MSIVVVSGGAVTPNLLTLVNRVRNECGIESVASSAATYDLRCVVTADAINDALSYINDAHRWPWQVRLTYIPLVAGTYEYSLPADFGRLCTAPKYDQVILREMSIEEWERLVDNTLAPNSGPSYFNINQGYIRLYPTPTSSFLTNTTTQLPYQYYKNVDTPLVDDSDAPDVPYELTKYIVRYAVSRLKKHLQDGDWVAEHQEAERMLMDSVRTSRKGRNPPQIRNMYEPFNKW